MTLAPSAAGTSSARGGVGVAALWMGGAIGSFSAMAVATRAVSPAFDSFGIMLWRSAIGLMLVMTGLAVAGRLAVARPRVLHLHAMRNLAHFAGQNLWLHALTVLPLAQVFALEFTSPLWVLVLPPLILGERLTGRGAVAGVMGFVGVLLVARPGAVLTGHGAEGAGLLAAALCAAFFALTAIATKRLTRTEPVAAIMVWLSAMQLALSAAAVAWHGAPPAPDTTQAAWLVAIALAGLAAHWCLTSALDAAPASVVMPLDFLRLPVIAVVGWALYGEPIGGTLVAGAALILSGNLLTLRRKGDVATS